MMTLHVRPTTFFAFSFRYQPRAGVRCQRDQNINQLERFLPPESAVGRVTPLCLTGICHMAIMTTLATWVAGQVAGWANVAHGHA